MTVFYLWRRNKPILFAFLPMLLMLLLPAWALLWQMFSAEGFLWRGNEFYAAGEYTKAFSQYLLLAFGMLITSLQVWMITEGLLLLPRVRGVAEEALPPLPVASNE